MASDPHPEFTKALFDVYRRAKDEANYNATIFLGMISKSYGFATAKTLINASQPSDGYTALYTRGRLDLTVEATVIENSQWHPLFTDDELQRARRRLGQYGYVPRGSID